MTVDPTVLMEHYQKTVELKHANWGSRNQSYLTLLGFVGLATLLTCNVTQAQPILVELIGKIIDAEEHQFQALRLSMPYAVIQSILLMIILYFMAILYHSTASMQRHSKYLTVLEDEIRAYLPLSDASHFFTRESRFYQNNRPEFCSLIDLTYISMLGVLLVSFLGFRVVSDIKTGSVLIVVITCLLAMLTLFFYCAYTRATLGYEHSNRAMKKRAMKSYSN